MDAEARREGLALVADQRTDERPLSVEDVHIRRLAVRVDAVCGVHPDGEGGINVGLASTQGGAAEARSALVAQQCALAYGVRPENDPGAQRIATP